MKIKKRDFFVKILFFKKFLGRYIALGFLIAYRNELIILN